MNSLYIRFVAEVNQQSIAALLRTCDQAVIERVENLYLMVSTPGGSVLHGITAYNSLKDLPLKITTFNVGSVDSIGVVLFCAGETRFSVPTARFLLHPVTMTVIANQNFEESKVQELLGSLKSDANNISDVIGRTLDKSTNEIHNQILQRKTMSAQEAKDYGLVSEVKNIEIPKGSRIIHIG